MNTGDLGIDVGNRIAEGAGSRLGVIGLRATCAALDLAKLGRAPDITAPPMRTVTPPVMCKLRWWAK
jgi:hypothetical protein